LAVRAGATTVMCPRKQPIESLAHSCARKSLPCFPSHGGVHKNMPCPTAPRVGRRTRSSSGARDDVDIPNENSRRKNIPGSRSGHLLADLLDWTRHEMYSFHFPLLCSSVVSRKNRSGPCIYFYHDNSSETVASTSKAPRSGRGSSSSASSPHSPAPPSPPSPMASPPTPETVSPPPPSAPTSPLNRPKKARGLSSMWERENRVTGSGCPSWAALQAMRVRLSTGR